MSTEQPTPETPSAPEQQAAHSIVDELTMLGKKLGAAIQAGLSSPQWHQVETEVREGFNNVVSEVNEAMTKARSTDAARQVGEQATKMVETVRISKVTSDVREGLIKGLKVLNRELDEAIAKMEPKPAEPEASEEPKV